MINDPTPITVRPDFRSRSIHLEDWPILDRARYESAMAKPIDLLSPDRRRRSLSKATLANDVYAYGNWLHFLDQHDALDVASEPESRMSPERVEQYVDALFAAGVSPKSIALYLDGTYRILRVLAPKTDLAWLRNLVSNARHNAEPVESKYDLPSIGELFRFGLEEMHNADSADRPSEVTRALRYRNGLAVALLAARPFMRRGDFHVLSFGRQLVQDGLHYRLQLESQERKPDRAANVALPQILTPWIGRYADNHLRILEGDVTESNFAVRPLWISPGGCRLHPSRLAFIISNLTLGRFGRNVPPHHFRNAAANSVSLEAPQMLHDLPSILDHKSMQVSEIYKWTARLADASLHLDAALCRVERE